MLPGWQGVALGDAPAGRGPDAALLALIALGALCMRSAGCAYNDIVDREADAKVSRTAARPRGVRPHIGEGRLGLPGGPEPRGALRAAGHEPERDPARRRFAGPGRGLSVHEADHLVAPGLAGADLQLGRAAGLRGDAGSGLVDGHAAVCGRGVLDARLRHHLRPAGPGGRRARRDQVERAAASAPACGVAWPCSTRSRRCWRWGQARRPGWARPSTRCGSPMRRTWAGKATRVRRDDPVSALALFKSNRDAGFLLFIALALGALHIGRA